MKKSNYLRITPRKKEAATNRSRLRTTDGRDLGQVLGEAAAMLTHNVWDGPDAPARSFTAGDPLTPDKTDDNRSAARDCALPNSPVTQTRPLALPPNVPKPLTDAPHLGLNSLGLPNLIPTEDPGVWILPDYPYEGELGQRVARAKQIELEEKEYAERSEAKYGQMFVPGTEYASNAGRLTRWVVDGLLPEGYLAILGATSKAGKTCFATALAMAVAKGEPFLGMPTRAGAVLWCAYEESEAERLEVLRNWPDQPRRLYITHEKPLIDDLDGLEAIKYWIYKTRAKLVIIDPLYAATSAETLVDGRTARRVLSGLKEICRKYNCAAIILHHITKDLSAGLVRERFADSNQILAAASMDMLMDSTDLRDGSRLLRISCRGRGAFTNRTLHIRSKGITHFELIDNAAGLPANQIEADLLIREWVSPDREGCTAEEIARGLNLNLQSVRNRLTDLLREGRIVAEGKLGRSAIYTARR